MTWLSIDIGWDEMARATGLKVFASNPSVSSSLKVRVRPHVQQSGEGCRKGREAISQTNRGSQGMSLGCVPKLRSRHAQMLRQKDNEWARQKVEKLYQRNLKRRL